MSGRPALAWRPGHCVFAARAGVQQFCVFMCVNRAIMFMCVFMCVLAECTAWPGRRDARMELLRRHTRGEAEPQCDAAQLERAASQLVDDMEASAGVVDSRLLARLCLLREELQQLVDEGTNLSGLGTGNEPASGGDSAAAPGQGSSPYTLLRVVPQSTVAFIKELMVVPSSERRRALLEKAFKEDWDGGTAHVASSRPASSGPGQADGTRDASSGVRPGRLLNGIKALQAELLGPQFQSGGDGGDGSGSGSDSSGDGQRPGQSRTPRNEHGAALVHSGGP